MYNNLINEFNNWFKNNSSTEVNIVEANTQSEGELTETPAVFTTIGGTSANNGDLQVVPFMLYFWFDEAKQDFYQDLVKFSQFYQNKSMFIELDNYKLYLNLPQQMTAHDDDGGGYRCTFIISGTMVIAKNLSDIKEILVDNQPLEFLQATINYTTEASSTKFEDSPLIESKVKTSAFSLQVEFYNRVNGISAILKALRTGTRKPNQAIKLKLKFTDGSEENYTTYIDSSSTNVDRQNPALNTIIFGLYNE